MQEYIDTSLSLAHKAASDYSFHNAGFEDCPQGYAYGPRICPYHLLHFVTKGKGELHMDGKTWEAQGGDAFFIPRDKIASYQASERDPWSYAWIGFLGKKADEAVDREFRSLGSSYVIRGLDTGRYLSLIQEAALLSGATQRNYYYANSILYRVIAQLFEDLSGTLRQTRTLAEEARYMIDMKYCEKVKMAEIAKALGIHPNYLTRTFKNMYGIAPKQYLTQKKLEKACSLLKGTRLPISLISDTLGFEDQMCFSRSFRQAFGLSPTQYREEMAALPLSGQEETLEDYVSYVP